MSDDDHVQVRPPRPANLPAVVDPHSEEGRRRSRNALLGPNNRDLHKPKVIRGLTAADLAEREIRPPDWYMEGYIYNAAVGCLYAPGGTGKSYVLLQMAVASALGQDFMGVPINAGRTVIWSCEDPIDVLHVRLDRIARATGHTLEDMEDRIVIFDRSDVDNTMLRISSPGFELVETSLFQDFLLTIENLEPALTVIDGLWNVYEGPENNRSMAYKVVTKFREIPQRTGSAALFTAHPSMSGMSSGEGTSGNTAWNGAFRSRMLLDRPERHAPERVLKSMKQNYGADDGALKMYWDDEHKVFLPDNPELGTVAAIKRDAERQRLVDAMWKLLSEGRRFTDGAKHSPNYYTKVIKRSPVFKRYSDAKIEDLMRECFESGLVRLGTVKDAARRLQESIVPDNWDDSGAPL